MIAATNPATAAPTGNTSLVLYRTTAMPSGYLATFDNGYYDGLGSANFSSIWTNIAVSRDSIMFYDGTTGLAVTGTFKDGAFTQLHTYGFSTGWDSVTASCDSVVLYDVADQTSVRERWWAERSCRSRPVTGTTSSSWRRRATR